MGFFQPIFSIQFLIGLLLKSALILSITLVLNRCLRKKSATLKHHILSCSLILLLLMPITAMLVPNWDAGVLPQIEARTSNAPDTYSSAVILTGDVDRNSSVAGRLEANRPAAKESAANRPGKYTPAQILVLTWLMGLGMVCFNVMVGLACTNRLTRQGSPLGFFPWTHLYQWYLTQRGGAKAVQLLENSTIQVPMSWGVFRPVVLLPQQAKNWPIDQCRAVLFHELCHIERKDFLVKLMGRIACGFYWYNPLTWLVFRKLKDEQEKACDERVLSIGIKPSIYASSLLQLKRTVEGRKTTPMTANGIFGPGSFPDRLANILKKQHNLKEMNMRSKLIITICLVFAVAIIGTANPFRSAQPQGQKEETKQVQAKKKTDKKGTQKGKDKKKTDKGKAIALYITDSDGKNGKKIKKFNLKKGQLFVKGDEHTLLIEENGKVTELKLDSRKIKKISLKDGKILLKSGEKGALLYEINGEDGAPAWTVRDRDKVLITGSDDSVTIWIQKDDKESAKVRLKSGGIVVQGGDEDDVMIVSPAKGFQGKDHIFISKTNRVIISIINDANGGLTHHILVSTQSKGKVIEKIGQRVKRFTSQLPAPYKVKTETKDSIYKITISSEGAKSKPGLTEKVRKMVMELARELKRMLPPIKKDPAKPVEV
jgi:beta-lactamase regulating signal transducer with metallopeptidase domain